MTIVRISRQMSPLRSEYAPDSGLETVVTCLTPINRTHTILHGNMAVSPFLRASVFLMESKQRRASSHRTISAAGHTGEHNWQTRIFAHARRSDGVKMMMDMMVRIIFAIMCALARIERMLFRCGRFFVVPILFTDCECFARRSVIAKSDAKRNSAFTD